MLRLPRQIIDSKVTFRQGTPESCISGHSWSEGCGQAMRIARFAQPALVNGAVGVVVVPHGWLRYVAQFTITGGKITRINVMTAHAILRQLHLAVLSD